MRVQASVVIATAFSYCVSCFASAFSSFRLCASSSGGQAHLWAERGRVFLVFQRVSIAVLNHSRELSESSDFLSAVRFHAYFHQGALIMGHLWHRLGKCDTHSSQPGCQSAIPTECQLPEGTEGYRIIIIVVV